MVCAFKCLGTAVRLVVLTSVGGFGILPQHIKILEWVAWEKNTLTSTMPCDFDNALSHWQALQLRCLPTLLWPILTYGTETAAAC